MRESQKCRKCGHVFSQFERTGPSVGGLGDIMRRGRTMQCPRCGGPVTWVDDGGMPLSPHQRMEDTKRHLRLALLFGAIALIGFAIVFLIVKGAGGQ